MPDIVTDATNGAWIDRVSFDQMPKIAISIRIDADVLAHFHRMGPGYQTRINAVLRAYVDHVTDDAA